MARPFLKYNRVGTTRQPLLADLPVQRVDLLRAQEQLAVAVRVVVGVARAVVARDVRPHEPGLAVADVRVGALEVGPALPERLHLRAGQDQAGLEPLEQVVLVPGPPVVRDQLFALRHVGKATASASASHGRSSTRKRGSIVCGSGYSR